MAKQITIRYDRVYKLSVQLWQAAGEPDAWQGYGLSYWINVVIDMYVAQGFIVMCGR